MRRRPRNPQLQPRNIITLTIDAIYIAATLLAFSMVLYLVFNSPG